MATEITVILKDQPGTLARLGAVLGEARVNIEAIQGSIRDADAVIQFVPSAPDRAMGGLAAAGIARTQREVLVVRVLDEPGMLGDVALVMSATGLRLPRVRRTGHCRKIVRILLERMDVRVERARSR